MTEWYANGICGDCACVPVCDIYRATGGGITQCKYMISRDLYGEWIYKACKDDESLMLYHCSLCDTPSAREYPYCRECGAKMEMGVEE